jgi:hypothetical protein
MSKPNGFNRIFNIQNRKYNIKTERLEMAEALFIIGLIIMIIGTTIGGILMLIALIGSYFN